MHQPAEMDPSLPSIPPPAYYISSSESHPHSDATFEQMLQHIPTPQPQHLSAPSPELTESKWARRSLSSHTSVYIPPSSPALPSSPGIQEAEPESKWARRSTCSASPWPQDENWDYTESRRNYRNESRKKFILFVVAILLMLAAMLAIVGATTHFRIRSSGCTTEYYEGSWVCI
ncbi:hypothetical protein N431DRAFT_477546 [Stipitochalara longipes BDJ]|nr:hypothetical protein N431DRAFT_477546 [Stipitochalara longipes BDJ]